MAKINISEGQPFTYQLLNQIIEQVNKIKDPTDPEKDVIIDGPLVNNRKKPKIVFGRTVVNIDKNQTGFVGSAKFKSGFTADNTVVIATLVDKSSAGGTQMGNLTITGISKTGFKYNIKLLRAKKTDLSFEIHYIAMGLGPDS